MSEPIKYVLGFLFNRNRNCVVLIKKTKPAWQAGLLNGVGGKIEPGEDARQAMIREFREETGVDTTKTDWSQFAELNNNNFIVYCYVAYDEIAYHAAKNVEVEEIHKIRFHYLNAIPCVSNVYWLIYMAIDHMDNRSSNGFYAKIQY